MIGAFNASNGLLERPDWPTQQVRIGRRSKTGLPDALSSNPDARGMFLRQTSKLLPVVGAGVTKSIWSDRLGLSRGGQRVVFYLTTNALVPQGGNAYNIDFLLKHSVGAALR